MGEDGYLSDPRYQRQMEAQLRAFEERQAIRALASDPDGLIAHLRGRSDGALQAFCDRITWHRRTVGGPRDSTVLFKGHSPDLDRWIQVGLRIGEPEMNTASIDIYREDPWRERGRFSRRPRSVSAKGSIHGSDIRAMFDAAESSVERAPQLGAERARQSENRYYEQHQQAIGFD